MEKLIIKNGIIPARDPEKVYNIYILNGKIEKIDEKGKITNSKISASKKNNIKLVKASELYRFKSSGSYTPNPESAVKISKKGRDIKELDANFRNVVPGYIDLHIQGAGGYDVLDGSEVAIQEISKTCSIYGVTGFLATTVYRASGLNNHLKTCLKLLVSTLPGAKLLGIHLEGPFISMNKRGMIQPAYISRPSENILDEIFKTSGNSLRMMTIAPELPGVEKIIKMLLDSSVVPSLGHSEATYEEAKRGFDYGISHVTHLFNAMAGLHHRKPGPLIAIYENKSVTCQLIADGVHIHPAVLRFTSGIITPQRLCIITDGMRSMGLPDGEYSYEKKKYISKHGTARYMDGTLVGTTLGFSELLNRFMNFTESDFIDVLKMGTEVPAKVLGMDNYTTSLQVGMNADLLILEKDFTPSVTIVEGRIVHYKDSL